MWSAARWLHLHRSRTPASLNPQFFLRVARRAQGAWKHREKNVEKQRMNNRQVRTRVHVLSKNTAEVGWWVLAGSPGGAGWAAEL